MLPAYAKAKGLSFSAREGWLSGSFDRISKELVKDENCIENNGEHTQDSSRKADGSWDSVTGAVEDGSITLAVAFPGAGASEDASSSGNRSLGEVIEGVTFYTFAENLDTPEIYDESLEPQIDAILKDFQPDIVHIFGTEFPHSLAMVRTFNRPERTLVGIQGLCGVIADKYMADLPESVQNDLTFRDKLKHDSIRQQQEKYYLRAANEKKIIEGAGHITGRTAFDKRETARINPGAVYHHMNETMRSNFYEGRWSEKDRVIHSIFLSQGDYPLKGLHYVLQAMPEILEKYPDAHVYVAGNSIFGKIDRRTVTAADDEGTVITGSKYPLFMRISAYGKYLKKLISQNHLKKHVTILGKLNAEQMKEQYLKCNVFICPSAVENSPNSLAEAMLLGVPVIAADVGGIPSMLDNNREGIIYKGGDVHQLAKAVIDMWDEPVISGVYGDNGYKRAHIDHDPDRNFERLKEIYREIATGARS